MKKIHRIFFVFCCILSQISIAQTSGLFNDPEAARQFFDGREYDVPGYGSITFEFNKSATKNSEDARMRDGSYDEMVDLIFDVSVKRKDSKKKDKGDYQVSMVIYLQSDGNINENPNQGYSMDFTLARQIIYPIKGFPSFYTVFSDGDLYFMKYDYKHYSFDEYKLLKLKEKNTLKDVEIQYIKCSSLQKK